MSKLRDFSSTLERQVRKERLTQAYGREEDLGLNFSLNLDNPTLCWSLWEVAELIFLL